MSEPGEVEPSVTDAKEATILDHETNEDLREAATLDLQNVPRPGDTVDFSTAKERVASVAASRFDVPGYEIISVLGRGGMGVVYQARHLRLNRMVALKMMSAGGH